MIQTLFALLLARQLKHINVLLHDTVLKTLFTDPVAGIVKACGLRINDWITYSLKKVDHDKGKHIICHSL